MVGALWKLMGLALDPLEAVIRSEFAKKQNAIQSNIACMKKGYESKLEGLNILKINFTKTGEAVRSNASCVQLNTFGTYYANYSCWVDMWYYDINGAWNIAVEINDTSNAIGLNTTHTFSINVLTAFNTISAINFSTLSPGATNTTASNYIQLNNTGNDDINIGGIDINATNLVGESNPSYAIYAGNFSISNSTGSSIECSGGTSVLMNSSQYTLINATNVNANLSRGNFSKNDGVTAQEQLYVCLRLVGGEISQQSYSTGAQGAWTIRILVVAFGLRKLKRRKKDNQLIKALIMILEDLRREYSPNKADAAQAIIKELRMQYRIRREEILNSIEEERTLNIPVSIFSTELGGLEALCKYLKENMNMTYHEAALLVKRNERTVWTAYQKASEKRPEGFAIDEDVITLPISAFSNDKLTVMESLVAYLKEKGIKYSEIGRMLNRDQRNIWTIYSHGMKKKSGYLE